MSRLDELIAKLCPDGVEYRMLSDVCKISNGKDHKELNDGNIPVYGSGGVMRYVDTYIYDKQSVLIPRKGSLGNLFYLDTPFWTVDTIFYTEINEDLISPKFMFYCLATKHLEDLNTAGGVPSLTKTILDKVSIPIPPLPVQEEIVRILDKFTALEAELEAELEARKKQYEFYLNAVLRGNHWPQAVVKWTKLGDACNISTGQAPTQEAVQTTGEFPFVNAGIEPSGYFFDKNSDAETITIPSRGQGGAGYIGYQKAEFWCGPLCYRIRSKKENVLTKYVYYYLKSIQGAIIGLRQTGSIPAINRKELILVQIPIPPLAEQDRIVAILDRFDALVNDITQGLPAEIEARRKQYEYYRDKLLTFKEAVSA